MSLIVSDKRRVILGLGKTGYSCVKFLSEQNIPVTVWDTREAPPYLEQCKKEFPNVNIQLGELDAEDLASFSQIILSPGLALNHPAIVFAKNKGVEIIGDVDLFVQYNQAKIIAITGSNAKSTVTTLVGHLLESIGVKAKVGGNLGVPMLELLDTQTQVYVLELSSFQLETTHQLNADVATVLNVSEDHMDRYTSFSHYHLAKHRIFKGCKKMVVNKDDALTQPLVSDNYPTKLFTKNVPDINQFGLITENGDTFLAKGFIKLINVNELSLIGSHNYCNYLAALALCESLDYNANQFVEGLKSFKGLTHRCEKIATINAVTFIDDSKATNVGATLAAIDGLNDKSIHLILGGVGKGADFSDLKPAINKQVKSVALIGECTDELFELLKDECEIKKHETLADSVKWLFEIANENDVVMLSPACASFDMFKNFEKRGEAFAKIVESLK
ncbi:MAG: UDP-N-acetylmuramoyl-L-alanine--D-glutamate ligase [Saccharospirillaceae bacterium]|nr:UDP-N-acetylmuramoyl-L-alanine--D-glutamate ligase [Pseudomonadales bacterium]NRB78194.1 UDP-N-acetylmuramoyl-L-alanine--D-glutamate ligase [Saccharospirillaceae bacterium]